MSIPMFFKAWKFSNNLPDNHIYVDGGVVMNYPLTVFDTPQNPDNPQTLGFFLYDKNGNKKPNTLTYDQPIAYCKALFETLLDAQVIDFTYDESMEKRSVKIDDFGIAATDFEITQQQKEQLYKSGVYYTEAYLKIPVLSWANWHKHWQLTTKTVADYHRLLIVTEIDRTQILLLKVDEHVIFFAYCLLHIELTGHLVNHLPPVSAGVVDGFIFIAYYTLNPAVRITSPNNLSFDKK